jgi:hypothetical protein
MRYPSIARRFGPACSERRVQPSQLSCASRCGPAARRALALAARATSAARKAPGTCSDRQASGGSRRCDRMRTFTVLVGVPAGMCVMLLFLRRFDLGSDGGTVTFVLGVLGSGCLAGILAGWRIGFGAAACLWCSCMRSSCSCCSWPLPTRMPRSARPSRPSAAWSGRRSWMSRTEVTSTRPLGAGRGHLRPDHAECST